MDRTCPKCGAVKSSATWKMDEACPSCGVIFAKAVAHSNAARPVEKDPPTAPWAKLVLLVGIPVAIFQIGSAMLGPEHRAVAPEPAKASSPAIDTDLSDAIGPCKQAIERQAKYQARWEGGWAASEFAKLRRVGPGAQYIAYGGNQLSLQNGFGAWEKMSYVCIWNPDAKIVVQAEVVSSSEL